jgi:ATP-dependent helicase/nuclease subunit A
VDAERVRLLYVGMTRARERLVLSGLHPELQAQRRGDTHAALLGRRQPTPPDWFAVHAACVASGCSAHDADGARWRILALEAAEPARSAPRLAREPVDARALRAEAERLRADAAAAAARSRLPRSAPASRGDRDDDAEPDAAAPRASLEAVEGGAELGRLVGSAVHRVLEHLDPGAEPDLEQLLGDALASLAPLATPQAQQAALDSARDLLARFAGGALGARFRALRGHVVARELPVLLPAGEDEATGFVAGAIDLVYRDPEGGELVVVDYKTDHLGPQGLPPERLAAYARQGAVYQRALREALALEQAPRFELWLLDADRCQVVRQDAHPSERSS